MHPKQTSQSQNKEKHPGRGPNAGDFEKVKWVKWVTETIKSTSLTTFYIDKITLGRPAGAMGTSFTHIFQAIQKGAIASLEAVQNGTTVALGAIQKGTTVSVEAIQKSASVSVEAIQSLSEIRGRPLSILNGVIGDTLEAQNSPLAIKMSLLGEARLGGHSHSVDAKALGGKLCILVHGLCDSEVIWNFPENPARNYGSLLKKDFGYAPLFYLRYNSGLHISSNGQLLAQLLSRICKTNSYPIQEIIFIGHSMGGLVVRSACHYGKKVNAPWVKHVKKIFLLGTPHHGTDLEKIGNLTSTILKKIPNLFTKGMAALGNKRSAGIKDLRFGYLLDEDWQEQDADALWQDNRHPVPLLKGVDYYIITASLAKESDNVFTQYFGDGLVPTRSAAGKHFRKSKTIAFLSDHFKTIKGLSHVGLAQHSKVYRQIKKWCR